MLDKLPNEIGVKIFENLDKKTLCWCREVSQLMCARANLAISKIEELEVNGLTYIFRGNRGTLNELFQFLSLFKNVKYLSLRNLPFDITKLRLEKIAEILKHVEKLEIDEQQSKYLEEESLFALDKFRNLTDLKIVGYTPVRTKNDNQDIIPRKTLRRLKSLEISCLRKTITLFVNDLKRKNIVMENLESVKFDFRTSNPEQPTKICEFVKAHPQLQSVEIVGMLFCSSSQLQNVYNIIRELENLKRVSMAKCSLIDRLDNTVQQEFEAEMKRRGVDLVSGVKSMRYGSSYI
ncbi:unnamed protein product [Caenorhabditis bovis]|uniref:F-box domain-containing protein n=1 Tax=Caenorhabditis bovis TaxID=2654633 RepID=A0A8S1EI32_9PELO|nr:unnamed protein product [Caenorhabditis bovis]